MALMGYANVMRSEFPRWRVVYSQETDVWRIYDLQHEAMQVFQSLEDDVPDDCPAVMVLPGQAVRALMKEMSRLDIVDGEVDDCITVGTVERKPEMTEKELEMKKYLVDAVGKTTDQGQLEALLKLAELDKEE